LEPVDDRPLNEASATIPAMAGETERTLRQAIELLFFAYRDFTSEADATLARYGFGRAHHRVIYFVGRHPGITVSELLSILRITKQSLARVLRQLMRECFIEQRCDDLDRRRRHLYLAPKAQALERMLTERQAMRIAMAYRQAGDDAARGFTAVLRAMINPRGPNDEAV
jgi:DNA-binding MarR family transcriptional regulator